MRTTVTLLLVVALLGGCGQPEAPAPSTPPPPTSVREADPCSFLTQSVVTGNGLERASENKAATSRSCSWSSASFSLMVLVRWDPSVLVDFQRAFPVPVGEMDLDGLKAVAGRSDVRPACAAVFFAEKGTVVEVVAGDQPPSTPESACARVRTIGTAAVREIRGQRLLTSTPAPTPT